MVDALMTGGLSLGDLVLDARLVVYIKSLRALACLSLFEAVEPGDYGALSQVLKAYEDYRPESLVVMGPVPDAAGLMALKEHLPEGLKVHVVTDTRDEVLQALAEESGFEWHQELVWARYRFVERLETGAVELYFVSAIGGAGAPVESPRRYALKVGRPGFGGMKLPVFLKGMGQVILPSLNAKAKVNSIFSAKELARYEVLAAGHSRVFPLGRVADLKPATTLGTMPLAVSTLGKKSAKPKVKKQATDARGSA